MDERDAHGQTVQATETSFTVVEYLKEQDGARLYEVADDLGLANSTAHKHLATLVDLGYVVREGNEYHLGLEFLHIGGLIRDRKKVNRLSMPVVRSLADRTGEQVQFIVEENGRGYHVYTSPGDQAVRVDTRIGKRIYLHANASGKAMMAYWDPERVDAVVDQWGLPAVTQHTITDRDELFEELEAVRERGYAYNLEEHIVGYRGVAAPVCSHDGEVLGALGVGGPTRRLKDDWLREDLPEMTLEAVNEFELKVEFAV
ncbi:IclR family transcriptional regulator [Halomarina pelagica]|uniref:IclR family transcriptional regulator n=1 Tax=Halomarina pelagica TaxID=2961599 RepID=UPI0020C3036D|nr:IclR family transcriptional regulator [Halomarina sp. BND7]